MEMASMGWMAVGIGRLAAPFNSLTTEDTEATEEFFPLEADASATLLLFLFFFTLCSGACAERLFPVVFFLSSFANVSASQGALTFPRDVLRSLSHSAEPLSPAISRIVHPVSADLSYFSMS